MTEEQSINPRGRMSGKRHTNALRNKVEKDGCTFVFLSTSFAFESFAAYAQANTCACVHSSCISNTYSLFVAYIAYTVHLSNWHKYIQWIYTQYRCRKSKSVYGCVMENVKITTRNSPYRYPAAFSPLQTN